MPIYEYRCEECGRLFEQLRRFGDADKDLKCPRCESDKIEHLLSAFSTGGCCTGSGSGGGFS